jgi:hypothetical protein
MRIPLAIAIAFILLLSGLAHSGSAGDFKTKYGDTFRNRLDSWWNLGIAAILISVFFNALVYMAGMATESQHLKSYAKAEFLQVTASSMMIFFASALLYDLTSGGSAMDLMAAILGTGQSTIDCAAVSGGKFLIWNDYPSFGSGPIGAFKCKVQEKINALDAAYHNTVEANKADERFTSVCINLFSVPVYCGDWDLAMHTQVEKAHLVSTKIVGLLMPLHAQFVLAEYIQKNMLAVFLPMGLMLRIFPVTRGVGGLFIALAIGFFFIWPTFFLLTDPTFVKADARVDDMAKGMCFTGFKGATVVLAGVLSPTGGSGAGSLATASAEEMVYQLTIGTLFYPFVALVLTLAFIRALTPLLGGDMGELMKMVSRLG